MPTSITRIHSLRRPEIRSSNDENDDDDDDGEEVQQVQDYTDGSARAYAKVSLRAPFLSPVPISLPIAAPSSRLSSH